MSVARVEITAEWIFARREAIKRYRQPIRKSIVGLAIEVKAAYDPTWFYLTLPRGQKDFDTDETRDEVFALLLDESGSSGPR